MSIRNSALPKPDVGGTMKKPMRVLFVIAIVIVLGISVVFSFNTLSRQTYEYEYTDNYLNEGKEGYIFKGFNGNADITELHIEHPMEKVDGEWVEGDGKVIAINSYTVNSDEYLKYIYIGADVEYINDQAFIYCKALRAFIVDENNPNYCSVDGILYNKDKTEIISYPICRCTQIVYDDIAEYGEVKNIGVENVETFTVKGKYVVGNEDASTLFTALKEYVKSNYSGDFDSLNEFDEFTALMDDNVYSPYIGTYYHITAKTDDGITLERFWTKDETYAIPEGVTKIASKAFYKCDRLVSVTIPSTVTEIGDMAFFNCFSMSTVTLPDGLKSMGDDAFSYCTGMNYAIYIPSSVKTIGHHCFYKCNLDMLFYMGAKDSSGMNLGGKWQPRNDNAFKADDPLWGKTRAEYDKYYNSKVAEAEKNAAETDEGNSSQNTSDSTGGLNKTAMIVMIICFIPGFAYIGVQIIRAVFKEDFLMTAKGKEKLKARKEEQERIHMAYINEGAEIIESEEANESEEKEENTDE